MSEVTAVARTRRAMTTLVLILLVMAAGTAAWPFDDDEYELEEDDEDDEGVCFTRTSWTAKAEAMCCDGWEPVPGAPTTSEKPTCRPKCTPPCVNSTCERHSRCHCLVGFYRPSGVPENVCMPLCRPHCENAECVAPKQCRCHSGFKPSYFWHRCIAGRSSDKPTPLAPVVASSFCSPECINGKCVNNICECVIGYERNHEKPWECIHRCGPPCGDFEQCTGPNFCECVKGYRRSTNDTCTPMCDSPCHYGRCVAPNKCECPERFELQKEEGEFLCVPTCNPPCGPKGYCEDVDKCDCDEGYPVGPEGDCMGLCTSEEEWDRVAGECRLRIITPLPTTLTPGRELPHLHPPILAPCLTPCIHGNCSDGHCVCERGWVGAQCSRMCAVLNNSMEVDARDCPTLKGCVCTRLVATGDGQFCASGSDPVCGEAAAAAILGVSTTVSAPSAGEGLPSWALWVSGVGAALMLLILVIIPSAVALHRRHRFQKRTREDDVRARELQARDMPCCLIGAGGGRMHDVDLDEWRFTPY